MVCALVPSRRGPAAPVCVLVHEWAVGQKVVAGGTVCAHAGSLDLGEHKSWSLRCEEGASFWSMASVPMQHQHWHSFLHDPGLDSPRTVSGFLGGQDTGTANSAFNFNTFASEPVSASLKVVTLE